MKTFEYTIKDPVGVHARPAGIIVSQAKNYDSQMTIFCGDKNANLKKLMSFMSLSIRFGQKVTVRIEGDDEAEAAAAMEAAFEENL